MTRFILEIILCQYPDIAQAYQELNSSLWETIWRQRDAHTDVQNDFIKPHVSEAKSSTLKSEKFHQKSW